MRKKDEVVDGHRVNMIYTVNVPCSLLSRGGHASIRLSSVPCGCLSVLSFVYESQSSSA